MTYRKDILEADFVILIMKDNYGTDFLKFSNYKSFSRKFCIVS